jgi:hypothetical protein
MSWENDVYLVEEEPPMNNMDPIVKMVLTPSAYRGLPENVEGHIAEYLLQKKIPRGTRGLKYRLPQTILRDRRLKKEIKNSGKAYNVRAQKRAYNEYMAKQGQAEMNAALAASRAQRAVLEAAAAAAAANANVADQNTWEREMSPSAQRKQARTRRGKATNVMPWRGKNSFAPSKTNKSRNKSKAPSKSTRKMREAARKQKSNENANNNSY